MSFLKGRGLRVSSLIQAALRLSVLALAVTIALWDRYGPATFLIEQAQPMVIIFALAYGLNAWYLTVRPPNWLDDHVLITLVSSVVSYLLAMAVLAAIRAYFSLGYILWFASVTIIGTLIIEWLKNKKFRSARLFLAETGKWHWLDGCPWIQRRLKEPQEVGQLADDDILIIDLTSKVQTEWRQAATNHLSHGGEVIPVVRTYEFWHGKVILEAENLFLQDHLGLKNWHLFSKRFFDIVVSVFVLMLLAGPGLLVGLVVGVTSSGGPLFAQKRIGLYEREFTIYKFRTMYEPEEGAAVDFTEVNDDRVTPVGRFLRRWRIDEWPQLVNVLRGDMSLVGPRPEQTELSKMLSKEIPLFSLRSLMRPGLSGWAQINLGYVSSVDEAREKAQYDLFYIKYATLALDLTIFIETLRVLFTGRGSR